VNVGISVENNTLYLAGQNGEGKKPYYYKSTINLIEPDSEVSSGYIWEQVADQELKRKYLDAEKIVLVIPAGICYAKKISLEHDPEKDQKEYQAWIAGNLLPGDVSKYIYGFIPLSESADMKRIDVLFYATLSEQFWPYFYAVIKDENYDRTCLLPEYMALSFLLRKSIKADSGLQAGIVNIGANGAAVVYIKDGSVFANRYFPVRPGKMEELKTDLETYFLSLIDFEKQTEILIAGKENLPALNLGAEARIRYNRLSAGFISALGSVEYITAGGKCELPAGN
jgi:hypothetical protein